ncbi:MAG: 3-hydroxyisobutyrate dehydrogenase [Acidiphilium sp. 37-67-22]|nr:MAG: 3-hydroxyisobutyrate dehydrogenase [Acidiphilium sp. 21-66-27]OYW10454.1 MAG: 3-hydroxyisobutyrate dehydrogenase [Acidiphilium sp. 37-67-22]HQT74415.1 3-hydroxyisobutyrate dehydrogenase [Acidiphilium sp.]
MARIGFIGLGNMGGPMAANLVRAGHAVLGFDTVVAAREAAAAAGVAIVELAADAARDADAVITMLPSGPIVRAVYEAGDGILPAARAGTLFIDCSTIDVDSARAAHAMAAGRGMLSLDAPVSGGVGGASAGTLTFMAGGSAEAFERGEPLLAAMGRRIVHCGGAGAGQAAKICNNMILGISMIAVSEAFALADRLGLDRQKLFDVASTASGQCWSLTSYCPVPGPVPASPANHEYRPGFAAALMLKDLGLAMEASAATGTEIALGRHAHNIYAAFAEAGHGGEDFSAIFRAISAASKPA